MQMPCKPGAEAKRSGNGEPEDQAEGGAHGRGINAAARGSSPAGAGAVQPVKRRNTRVPLVPPNPKELDRATSIFMSRAVFATWSRSHFGSWLKILVVGGDTWWCTARAENTASTPPAAPSRCPVMDLVEFTATFFAWSPSRRLTATLSARSPSGVEVPW